MLPENNYAFSVLWRSARDIPTSERRYLPQTLTFVGVLQLMIYTDTHINVQRARATLPSGKIVVSNEAS